ncbi:MAG TPA: AMP-binding protein [Pseudonocardia sp.]|nr:AMP-binding protein [Pseudonocardia sp.]
MIIEQEIAREARAEISTVVRTVAPPTTLPDLLARRAQSLGTQPAFTCLDHEGGADLVSGSLSWRELDQRVDDVASVLLDRLEPGQRVAILGAQGLDHMVGFLGVLRAGVIAVPLFATGAGRLRTVLTDCRPSVVLTTRAELAPVCRFVGPYQAVVAIEDFPAGASPRRPNWTPARRPTCTTRPTPPTRRSAFW